MRTNLFLLMLGLGIFLIALLSCSNPPQKNYLNEPRQQFDERMAWWREARFGMFIHWGIYSVPAGVYKGEGGHAEWIMETAHIPVQEYERYATQFNPVKFNADEWVQIAKNAGMKYIVITSKHHDGFCLWDSHVSDYDIIDRTPFKLDVLHELAVACREQGIKLCFYHSIMDWHHPDARGEKFPAYRENYLKPQLKELVNRYGKLGVLWFDGEWIDEWTEDQGKELYNYVRNLQPDIIINNRVGKGRSGMQGMNSYEGAAGDFGTPEQEVLQSAAAMDWESCMTMNDHWGFNAQDDHWKSPEMLVHHLVDIAAKGGNFLLNVGPTSEGLIPQPSIDRLREIGDWMKIHSEVIYGTHRLPFYREGESIRYIQSHDKSSIYACSLGWPGSSITFNYVIPEENSEIFLLGQPHALDWDYDATRGLTIRLPEPLLDETARPMNYAYCFKIKGAQPNVAEKPIVNSPQKQNLSTLLFSENVSMTLRSPTDGAQIRYTLDGSEPNLNSLLYHEAIQLSTTTIVRAAAFKEGYVKSETAAAQFILANKYKRIALKQPASDRYPGQGELTLGDWERGSSDFRDGKWLGFEQENFEAVVDLGQLSPVKKITTGFLQNIDSWIWLPTSVEYGLSADGQEYSATATVAHNVAQKQDGMIIQNISQEFDRVSAQFVRIRATNIGICPPWHKGAGGKAWLFVDEIIVE